MGSAYLKTHKLPWYVAGKISSADPNPVISLRDVADRAIQMYLGGDLVNYNQVQFKPRAHRRQERTPQRKRTSNSGSRSLCL